jgi:hypothetical protein
MVTLVEQQPFEPVAGSGLSIGGSEPKQEFLELVADAISVFLRLPMDFIECSHVNPKKRHFR